jgi:AcrR family transcriptional regulator
MVAATIATVGELGYAGMTVTEITRRAGVSRKTFYEIFSDREDCFLVAFEQTLTDAMRSASGAYVDQRDWRTGIRAALQRLLVLMEEQPALARLLVVEALHGGDRLLERRVQALDGFAQMIDQGRQAMNGRSEPPEITAEGIVGGVLALLHRRLLSGAEEPLLDLLGPLMYVIVLPYLGARDARRELQRATPRSSRPRPAKQPPGDADPLGGLNTRLTYRTVLVLGAVEECPGASNREVGERSGVVDQGQISKLLSRLARLGLIENHGLGQPQGAANAWELTRRGAEVLRSTRPHGHARMMD